ncbi:MAG: hypothetical protein OXI79_00240 [Gammaproteobacteria bacterium]|nr:hypothetical protein [Gammaproteobacteria bacterium]
MAFTIGNDALAVAIRAAADPEDVPDAVADTLAYLVPAAKAIILKQAPDAPDAVHDAALIRLAGWLYDAEPAGRGAARPLQSSGAAPLLAPWRVHRAGVIGEADE